MRERKRGWREREESGERERESFLTLRANSLEKSQIKREKEKRKRKRASKMISIILNKNYFFIFKEFILNSLSFLKSFQKIKENPKKLNLLLKINLIT